MWIMSCDFKLLMCYQVSLLVLHAQDAAKLYKMGRRKFQQLHAEFLGHVHKSIGTVST
jgi:hypothetical protein